MNHVVRGGRAVKATMPTSPNPTPISVTVPQTRDEVTATRKKGRTAKSAPIVTVGPKQAPVTQPAKPAKHRQSSQPTPMVLVAPSQTTSTQSPLEEISDILNNLPLKGCVELTRRLLTSVPTLPAGPARTRAVLKIVVLFVADYGSTA
jgi:hypothetical protein